MLILTIGMVIVVALAIFRVFYTLSFADFIYCRCPQVHEIHICCSKHEDVLIDLKQNNQLYYTVELQWFEH